MKLPSFFQYMSEEGFNFMAMYQTTNGFKGNGPIVSEEKMKEESFKANILSEKIRNKFKSNSTFSTLCQTIIGKSWIRISILWCFFLFRIII